MKKVIILSALLLSSCSVVMAGSKKNSMFEEKSIKKEITRKNFELNISKDIITEETFDNITIVTYHLNYDKNAKYRMLAHLGLDIVTLGAWEVVGTVGEVKRKPDFYYIDVTYNLENKITAVDIYNYEEDTGEV